MLRFEIGILIFSISLFNLRQPYPQRFATLVLSVSQYLEIDQVFITQQVIAFKADYLIFSDDVVKRLQIVRHSTESTTDWLANLDQLVEPARVPTGVFVFICFSSVIE